MIAAQAVERGGASGPPPSRWSTEVTALTVLYDSQCPVCRRSRAWVQGQATLVPVDFVAAGSNEARALYPDLDHGSTLINITVIDAEGRIYRGDSAWIMVLWAVASTRALAVDVAQGRKGRTFRSVKGVTDLVRSVTAGAATPPPPAVPPPPIDGWNAPVAGGSVGGGGGGTCTGDTCS